MRQGARCEFLRDILGHANIDVTQNIYGGSWLEERVESPKLPKPQSTRSKCEKEKRNQPESVGAPDTAMASRVRHCVECPKCFTRYLPGFSPYRNGSYLMPLAEGFADEWTLYCACGRPAISSRWSWSDLKLYAVSNQAHDRGYGPPEEIVPVGKKSRFSG
jgi:hypothetical protein